MHRKTPRKHTSKHTSMQVNQYSGFPVQKNKNTDFNILPDVSRMKTTFLGPFEAVRNQGR